MSNRFYNFVNQLISGSVAKASEVNAEMQGAEVGFSTVQAELNTAIKLPADESLTDHRIVETPVQRAGKLMQFNSSGDLVLSSSLQADISVSPYRIRNLPNALAADEPVNLSQLSSYSAGLTGLPAIDHKVGPLLTDGSIVFWGTPTRDIPDTATVNAGSYLAYTGGQCRWQVGGHNVLKDPSGNTGSGWWTTSLSRNWDHRGPHWINTGGIAGSFDHKPVTGGWIACGVGQQVTGSVQIDTTGMSAGAGVPTLRFYDGASSLIGLATSGAALPATANAVYSVTATAPASTVWMAFSVEFSGVSATAYGIIIRNMKLEQGAYPTLFNDFNTVSLLAGVTEQTYFGAGYTLPIVTIGDATATTARLDFRSAAGAQLYDAKIASAGGTNGSAGKGTLTVTSLRTLFSGPIGSPAEYANGNSGAAKTIDFLNGPFQSITLNAATPALTINSTSLPIGKYQLRIVQDGTGSRAPTWVGFAAAYCLGNALPTIASAANAVTFVNFYWDGSSFWVSSNPWD
jgi:hypothetical protein